MNDKEMIEEMASIMLASVQLPDNINSAVKLAEVNKAYYLVFLNYATRLYNAGCRIVAKDSVVLSREEWKQIKNSLYYSKETLEKKLAQERKETAEKILNEVHEFFKPFDKKSPIFLDLLITKIENIAKQFGCEIGE